jgi:hypothetical protein
VQERLLSPRERRLDRKCRVEGLDDALGTREVAVHDRAGTRALGRPGSSRRQVDVADLEERDVLVPRGEVAAGRLDEPADQRGPKDRLVGRQRHRQLQRRRIRVAREERGHVDLREAAAGEDVLDRAAQALRRAQASEARAPEWQRVWDVVQPETDDLLHEVGLAAHVSRAPGRHGHVPVLAHVEPETRESLALLVRRDLEARELGGSLRPQPDHGPLRQLALDVDVAGPARPGQRDDQLRGKPRRVLREVGVYALFPPVGTVGPQAQPLRRLEDRDRLEVRGLEQDIVRLLRDLRLLAAHDPGDRDRALAVGDHEVALVQPAQLPVERPQLLTFVGPPHDDPAAGERREVERVQRVPETVHHVVRHVDDVGDGPHACGHEPGLQPRRRRADRDVAEDPADVPRASLEVLDGHGDRLLAGPRGLGPRPRSGVEPVQGTHLARDAVHRQQVRPVRRRLELDHVVAER